MIARMFKQPRKHGGAPWAHVVTGDRLHDDGVAEGVAGEGVAHVGEACDGGGAEGGLRVERDDVALSFQSKHVM